MSEFSQCLYLDSRNKDDGIQLLKAHRTTGYVFEPRGGWLQLLVGGSDKTREQICRDAPVTVLDYRFAADHEWGFVLFEDGQQIIEYRCAWEGENRCDLDGAPIAEFAHLLGSPEEEISEVLYLDAADVSHDDLRASASGFCESVGLPNYSWTSFRYENREVSGDVDATYVTEDGAIVSPEQRTAAREAALRDTTPTVDSDTATQLDDDRGTKLARAFLTELVERDLVMLEADTEAVRDSVCAELADAIRDQNIDDSDRLAEIWGERLLDSFQVLALRGSNQDLAAVVDDIFDAVGSL